LATKQTVVFVFCTRLVSWKVIAALPLRSFRIRCKHVRPRSRLIFNKIRKAEKFAFFSTECSRSSNSAGNARTVIAWPRHYDFRAFSKIANTSFDPSSRILQVFSLSEVQQFGSQPRILHRDEKGVAVATISASIAPAAAHNSIKQSQSPRLNIRDAARLILRHILAQNQHFTSGILSTAENKT